MQYIPPTQPYELSSLISDLVRYARFMLKPGGRLVFFLPTVTDEYTEVDVYTMLCDGMEVIANSVQDFGSWGRRVSLRKSIPYGCDELLILRVSHCFSNDRSLSQSEKRHQKSFLHHLKRISMITTDSQVMLARSMYQHTKTSERSISVDSRKKRPAIRKRGQLELVRHVTASSSSCELVVM